MIDVIVILFGCVWSWYFQLQCELRHDDIALLGPVDNRQVKNISFENGNKVVLMYCKHLFPQKNNAVCPLAGVATYKMQRNISYTATLLDGR